MELMTCKSQVQRPTAKRPCHTTVINWPSIFVKRTRSLLQGDQQTDWLTDWPRYCICSNRPLSLAISVMRPQNWKGGMVHAVGGQQTFIVKRLLKRSICAEIFWNRKFALLTSHDVQEFLPSLVISRWAGMLKMANVLAGFGLKMSVSALCELTSSVAIIVSTGHCVDPWIGHQMSFLWLHPLFGTLCHRHQTLWHYHHYLQATFKDTFV